MALIVVDFLYNSIFLYCLEPLHFRYIIKFYFHPVILFLLFILGVGFFLNLVLKRDVALKSNLNLFVAIFALRRLFAAKKIYYNLSSWGYFFQL